MHLHVRKRRKRRKPPRGHRIRETYRKKKPRPHQRR